MKFVVSSSVLSARIQAASRAIASKNSLEILDCFLFDLRDGTLSISASDSETTITSAIEVNESDGNGRFAISSHLLLNSLKEIPEQPLLVTVDLGSYAVNVKYQNGEFNLVAQPGELYPTPVELKEDAVYINIPVEIFMNGISRAVYATADDELRPVMNGIYLDITPEHITFVASDGHKMVRDRIYSVKGTEKAAFILPKKPALFLKGIVDKEEGDVAIGFDDRNAQFTVGSYRMTCRLIEGRFPNYNAVIPTNNVNKMTVDRAAIVSAMRRVAVFTDEATGLIKMTLRSNEVEVSTQNLLISSSAVERLLCEYNGTPMSIGCKAVFLIDLCSNIASDSITFELADPSRAGVIVPSEQTEAEDLLMLLMPMMLNN